MITAITQNTDPKVIDRYKKLFTEASDILRGFRKIRTYAESKEYYIKDITATAFKDMFEIKSDIKTREDFINALADGIILYEKIAETPSAGINADYGINTLEEYFANLADLKDRGGVKYTVLPLDEDYFEINANTRAILIPASFKKNGIAVQSDDLAEVVYFKVDRYFDYTDLDTCEIFIQWETPKGPDGTIVKSADRAYLKDIESEPGKLIFGWVLDKDITAYAGNLKFSVRFVKWSDGQIVYSLSTLAATAIIQPSINFELKEGSIQLDDAGARLLERIENGKVIGQYAAAKPEFIINLSENPYDCDENGEFDFAVYAETSDNGVVSYKWVYKDPNGDEFSIDAKIGAKEVEKKAQLDDRFIYYTDIDLTQLLGKTNLTETEIDNESLHIYVEAALVDWDKFKEIVDANKEEKDKIRVGKYWAVASNRITNSTTRNESQIANAPAPQDIVFTKVLPEAGILNQEGKYTATIELKNNEIKDILAYQWYKEKIDDKNNIIYEKINDATDIDYIVQEEGKYGVVITNTRNRMTKTCEINNDKTNMEKVYNPIIRVTQPATLPEIIYENNNYNFTIDELKTYRDRGFKIKLDMVNVSYDKVKIAWYFKEAGQSALIYEQEININNLGFVKDENEKDTTVTNSILFNPFNDNTIIADIKEASKEFDGVEDITGLYYPIVKIYYNCIDEKELLPAGSVAISDAPDANGKHFTIAD